MFCYAFSRPVLSTCAIIPPMSKRTSAKPAPQQIYQLKITLHQAPVPVWRRVLVLDNYSLGDLHFLIQAAMGWYGGHLHQFDIDGVYYSDPSMQLEETADETRVYLSQFIGEPKQKFRYEYDFGDDWVHIVLVEKILSIDPKQTYPQCVKGVGACPPEDCGGVWGYAGLLDTLNNPKSDDYEEMREWLNLDEGETLDPKQFDNAAVNAALTKRIKLQRDFKI